ncbi:MAG: elongation factor G, partial [Hyphomicrobiaceae bacterium]|nr:elongation factor G [Hyphomicrobiaceae bacterium]
MTMGQELAPRGARRPDTARCIAIAGPFLSGKTTLLEAILTRTGTLPRQGTIADKSTIGDTAPEARDHGMSSEANIAETTFLDDTFTFIDLPGSIEFQTESAAILPACDAVIVVCEPDPKRVPALQLILKNLTSHNIPHLLFLNKMDTVSTRVRDILPMLQPASPRPLVLRQIPIWNNGVSTG